MESGIVQYPALAPPLLPALQRPRTLAQSLSELPFGSQSQVAVATGKVAAFLAYAGYDRKTGVASYALRVLNDSASPVSAQLWCVMRDGTQRSASPLTFKVAPYAMRDDLIPVRLDITGRFERAVVEVVSDDTYFTVEASSPPPLRVPWMRWSAAALLPVVAAGTIGAMSPRVAPLNAPEKAYAGTSIAVPYEASGYGSVEYSLTARDGVQLAAGLADGRGGVLKFVLPAQSGGSPYTVHVRMRSPFASAEQSATVAAVAVAAKPARATAEQPALIDELRVAPEPVRAGQSLRVEYAAHATDGEVALVDASGATWSVAAFSPAGVSLLQVPAAAAGRTMRVVLRVQRGKSQAQSSVDAMVLASDRVQQPKAPAAPAKHDAAPAMSLSSTVAAAGETIDVHLSGMHGDVSVTVTDATGATVAQGDGSEGTVAIAAPMVRSVTSYFVVASFTDGFGQQSIVKRLVVTPR